MATMGNCLSTPDRKGKNSSSTQLRRAIDAENGVESDGKQVNKVLLLGQSQN